MTMNHSESQLNVSRGCNGSSYCVDTPPEVILCWSCASPTSQSYRASVSTLGIIFSLLPAILLSRRKDLRKFAICQYLSAKCAVDTGFLTASTLQWLPTVYPIVDIPEGACQIIVYASYTCNMLSAWYLCAVVASAYLSLSRQQRFHKTCSSFRSKCYITVLAVMAIVLNLYWTWMSGKNHHLCVPMFYYHMEFLSIVLKVELAIVIVIPDLMIIGLTFMSAFVLVKRRRTLLYKTPINISLSTDGDCHSKDPIDKSQRDNERTDKQSKVVNPRGLTNAALGIAALYLLMSLPWHGIRLKRDVVQPASAYEQMLGSWLHLISLTYFALNFVVCLGASRRFRRSLWDLVCHCRCLRVMVKGSPQDWTAIDKTDAETRSSEIKDECVSSV